jgi:hypothetical protein
MQIKPNPYGPVELAFRLIFGCFLGIGALASVGFVFSLFPDSVEQYAYVGHIALLAGLVLMICLNHD